MSEKTAVEVLEGAKEALQKHGWTQNQFVDEDTGCICLGEAIYIGADQEIVVQVGGRWQIKEKDARSQFRNMEAVAAARRAIRAVRRDDDSGGIATFNDMPGQTKRKIIATINKAIALLKEEAK